MTPADLIKQFEGCTRKSFRDTKGTGKPWTVGYGCTGPDIGPDTVWTQEQCEAQLEERLERQESAMAHLILVETTPDEYAALCSLVWNIGIPAFAESHLLIHLNARNYGLAADQFLVWNHSDGRVNPVLVDRRHKERLIFLSKEL